MNLRKRVILDYKPCDLYFEVVNGGKLPSICVVCVKDANDPNKVFTKRFKTIDKKGDFLVKLPLAPYSCVVEVKTDNNQNIAFQKLEKRPIKRTKKVSELSNKLSKEFVEFAQPFCYNLSNLSSKKYHSKEGTFEIELLNEIVDSKGNVLTTPARIDVNSGLIQVSKKQFTRFTIPMRMIVLLHEFSHVYLNKNSKDETEADLNALEIYLSLGYPPIEGHQAFLETFKGRPTQMNMKRYGWINQYINENKLT
jgi:hypothetical protein